MSDLEEGAVGEPGGSGSTGPAERLQDLLERLELARAKLEAAQDPEQAVEVLGELNELAREVQAEVERARREGPDSIA